MKRIRHALLITALATGLTVAGSALAQDDRPADLPRYGSLGLETGNMNRDVVPGDDFYSYMEGNWVDHTSIPADKARIGYNYTLDDTIDADLRKIVDDAVAHPDTPAAQRIAKVWTAWMDEDGIAKRGVANLQPLVARIAAVHTRAELLALMAQPGFAQAISVYIGADPKAPDRYAVFVGQGRLGLPVRDYYLDPGEKYAAIRKAYQAYVAQIFTLAGVSDADARAAGIMALETAIAKEQWTPERQRDVIATYNPMLRPALAQLTPGLDWDALFKGYGLTRVARVVVREKSAVAGIARHLARDPMGLWQDYLVFRMISDHAEYLPAAFDAAHFAFYDTQLQGLAAQEPRWKRGIEVLNSELGQDLGQIYLKTHWSADADTQMAEMIDDLKWAYADRIGQAAWMDEPTRKAALDKLAKFEARIAGPKKPIDYTDFHAADDPFVNALESARFGRARQIARFGGPVDRDDWYMNPQTVNAYYDSSTNQVTFPAAELQPPFFDPNADPAVNYGAAGATIGHEMGHGFDDRGRKYDGTGRLTDWWTKASADKYKLRADALIKQFDAYEPLPGVHVKGALTLGENLADLGGLETAYAAWRRYQARHGEAQVIDGMTGDQRFFLSYAQSWQYKIRDEALRDQLLTDPHSPDTLRVNGIVRNFDPWYAAFDVKPENKLYLPPDQRVKLW